METFLKGHAEAVEDRKLQKAGGQEKQRQGGRDGRGLFVGGEMERL